MKIKGLIKKSFNKGTIWKSDPVKCEWDGKSATIELNNQTIQITDCKSTFDSARNSCIYVMDVIKPKARKKKEIK